MTETVRLLRDRHHITPPRRVLSDIKNGGLCAKHGQPTDSCMTTKSRTRTETATHNRMCDAPFSQQLATATETRYLDDSQEASSESEDLSFLPPPAKFNRRKGATLCSLQTPENRFPGTALLKQMKRDVFENILIREFFHPKGNSEIDELWESTQHWASKLFGHEINEPVVRRLVFDRY